MSAGSVGCGCQFCDREAIRYIGTAPVCAGRDCQARAVKANERRDPRGRYTPPVVR